MVDIDRARVVSILPWAFIACFIISALIAQLGSDVGPWKDRSPIEYFTGGLLWMLSVLCLLLASLPQKDQRGLFFWIAGCVVLSTLAIDEAMGGHEWVEKNWHMNDDFPKVVLWIITFVILFTIYSKVKPYATLKYVFSIGYMFHAFYLIFEFSDGEFYDASNVIGKYQAKWGEEISELFFLSAYWLGFVLFYQKVTQTSADEGNSPGGGEKVR